MIDLKTERKIDRVINAIRAELERAMQLHPKWPTDPVRAAAIVSEEAGELVKAVNDYESRKTDDASADYREAIQTAATAIRFCVAWDSLAYDHVRSEQPK